VAFHPSFFAADLRSPAGNDSKPEREETQQRETHMSETKSARAGWQPATYYPDPAIHAIDPRFEKYWLKLSAVERLTTGLRWAEGPVWFGDGRYLLCSDIPNNRIIKWEEETGAVSVFRKPSNFANGHTRDRQGRLIGCEHGGRRVVRTEYDGSITVLMDSFDGKRLNAPNDVVVKSDGSIWFTDPVFGLLGNYEGYKAEPELDMNVYRIDGKTGKATIVCTGVLGPNGLCFSPDEKILYVIESRGVPTRKILAYDVDPDGDTVSNKRVHVDAGPGTPDGMRSDIDGNLWCGWGMGDPELDGVVVFAPDGVLIGRIALPERRANLCFGGLKRNRLFMAASQSIYALYVNTQGALGG
jgi:gluconolactonase